MNKYLIAEQRGGIQGDPGFTYVNPETIESDTKENAIKIYNEKHKCNFFYGVCLGELK